MSGRDRNWTYLSVGIAVVLLHLLTACSAYRSSEGPLTLFTPSPVVILPSATPTRLPSPVPSTLIPSPTHTPAPPPITPRPTRTAEEEQAFVREMLETNGGCELPCWWGITPGKTTWQEVRERLGFYYDGGISRPSGMRYHETAYGDVLYPPPPPYGYSIYIGFTERDGIVQSIEVFADALHTKFPQRFAQDWHRYSLDQVLTRYGEPSQVMLELWPNPPAPPPYYQLFVFYEHRGILIAYDGLAVVNETAQVCPGRLEEVLSIEMWLQSPDRGIPLLQMADLDPAEQAQMLPLEEATGMDVQTFYETFRQAGTGACLESPVEVWP